MKYRVHYGYRTDQGMQAATSTHWDTVTVEAQDEACARLVAIDAAYDQCNYISHVRPLFVVEEALWKKEMEPLRHSNPQ